MAFEGRIEPLVGNALLMEYESVLGRDEIFARGPFDADRRAMFLDDVLSVCRWVEIHYLWRPNLKDEGDNHVLELALAGQAAHLITQNIRDFRRGELATLGVEVLHPFEFLNLTEGRQQWLY